MRNTIRKTNNLKALFERFMNMGIRELRLDHEALNYSNKMCCYSCMHKALYKYSYPIAVRLIKGEVYLTRWDI